VAYAYFRHTSLQHYVFSTGGNEICIVFGCWWE